ncbi:MAG: ATP-binding cassette domain-containing protein [Anaerolineales bacterium]|uniref:ATP-binding cassette domain-containing protein n=1 Tax=Candidatus Desulfolinea nitratireducens TaxID=2841698 RepID=A0A8J6TJK7_9CHLR|nr:ATP-binding cassette domain-containing protein [Candidatus Desulfolinea nitratireducens]
MSLKQVSIQNVTYSYPEQETPALKDISLSVNSGEVLAIMGPTGAGKTTLALLLNGLIPQFYEGRYVGNVTINGLSTNSHSIQDLVEHIGLVLQDPETQIFGITVFEDTAFGPSNLGYPREKIFSEVEEALSRVRLSGFEDRLTSTLSGGEKQRLAIAGVLAMQPEILVLDEPTSELDSFGRVEIIDAVQHLRSRHQTTVILIDHEVESVIELADRVAVIIDGKVAWLGDPRELFRNARLTKEFSIRPPKMFNLWQGLADAGLVHEKEEMLTVDNAEAVLREIMRGKKFLPQPGINPKVEEETRHPIIEIDGLCHTYPTGVEALSGVSCSIRQGELIAVIGQNGAGKSTLVKHLNGLLQPSSGSIKVKGVDTRSASVHELAHQIGYVFQNPDHQIFSMTVEDELRYGLKNLGLSEADHEARLTEALEFVGLQDQRDRHPFSLGKGERQKVAVASILAIAPPVICIDEPTTGLDWTEKIQMMELIQKVHQKGHTVIMITHDMDLVAEYAQRVLLVSQGEILLDDTPSRIFSEADLLRKSHIIPPAVSQLAERLGDLDCPGTICTISQMMDAITTLLRVS